VRQPLEPDALRHLVTCLGDPAVGGASGHIVFVKSDGGGEADVGLYWRFEKWLRDKLTAVDSLLVPRVASMRCAASWHVRYPLPP